MNEMKNFRSGDFSFRIGWIRTGPFNLHPLWLAILVIFSFPISQAQQGPGVKNVLILEPGISRNAGELDSFESGIRAHASQQINFYVMPVDTPRSGEKFYLDSLAETINRAFGGLKPDLVIAVNFRPLQFAIDYRDRIFPGTPIVFTGVDPRRLRDLKIPPGVTGVPAAVFLGETIDLALRLQPDTKAIAIIAGEKYWLEVAHSELLLRQDKVKEIDIVGYSGADTIQRVAALPPHTVALFQLAPSGGTQPDVGAMDVLAATTARMPTYSAWPALCLNLGCIGGYYNDGKADALTGQIIGRVLSGERPENIPIVASTTGQAQVDWRQLQRWHIPESSLPPGSVVLYRDPSLWEKGRKYLLVAIVLIGFQTLLIVGLLWQRVRKRKAEAALRESEKRFRIMADTTPSLIWVCDSEGKITYLNDRRIEFTGSQPGAGYGDTWVEFVHPDDINLVLNTVSVALKEPQPFSMEYRLRRIDGIYRWMFDIASPRVNGDGTFAGFIGSVVDTTEQKLAQQALQKMSGHLIEAQERERSRIGRELHDDICQRLALLSLKIDQVHEESTNAPTNSNRDLQEISKLCGEIGSDVQSLSHHLHSPVLEYLGIAAATSGFCRNLSMQYNVDIAFSENNVPKDLSKDTSLCLFRVAQEALHNGIKYSGAKQFIVELVGKAEEIQLTIADSGIGFDVAAAKKKGGLGLMSMQERVNLVHGSFHLESSGDGTTITAIVPLPSLSSYPLVGLEANPVTTVAELHRTGD